MGYTWGEIKKTALDLMFTTEDASDAEAYIKAMPEAANYALRDLACVCRPIVRKFSISHVPVKNMLGDSYSQFDIKQSVGEDIIYSAVNPKAYYFEVDGPCTVLVQQVDEDGNVLNITSHVHEGNGSFSAYRGLIGLTGEIRLTFLGGGSYNIRNVAFYDLPFETKDDIPPFTRYDRYNLKKMIGPTFRRLSPDHTVVVGEGTYLRSDMFFWEPDDTFVVDHYAVGQFDIFYEAYPVPITADTDDKYELDGEGGLPAEALDLVPLYIAGRLYAEDSSRQAASYRNQYSVRRAELSEDNAPPGDTPWACNTGWW